MKTKISTYGASGTLVQKRIAYVLLRVISPFRFFRLKIKYLSKFSNTGKLFFEISQQKGFCLLKSGTFPLVNEAVEEALFIFRNTDIQKIMKDASGLLPFISIPLNFPTNSNILKLLCCKDLMFPIFQYFGEIPALMNVQLIYSPNDRVIPGTSQEYHFDGQDFKSLQVFIFCDDVSLNCGPVTVVSARDSSYIAKKFNYRKKGLNRRLSDDAVNELSFTDSVNFDIQTMIGPKGTILFFDGDRCLHYGSRAATKSRLILQFFFTSHFGFTHKDYNRNIYSTHAKDYSSELFSSFVSR